MSDKNNQIPRNTKRFIKRFQISKTGERTENPLPRFIERGDKGWIELTTQQQVEDIYPAFVSNKILEDFKAYRCWVHETDIAFTKGIYEEFKKSLESQLGDGYALTLFKKGFSRDSKIVWFQLKRMIEEELKIEIVENYPAKTVSIEYSKPSTKK